MGVYKIGFSRNYPSQRLRGLQVGSPVSLRLVVAAFVDNAPQEEKRLHKLFAEKNVHYEWFKLSLDDLKGIGDYFPAAAKIMSSSKPRSLSSQEARVVLALEEQGREKTCRMEVIQLLGASAKAADHIIQSLRDKGWFERTGWGRYALISSSRGMIVQSSDKRLTPT
jgi:Meiotically up-regulated gene 113